jgi:ArsR family transcriptional regulator
MTTVGAPRTIFDALSSRVRREILWLTWNGELTVGQIAAQFDLAAPTLSSHLTVLRDAGLVTMRAERNFRHYRADQAKVRALLPLLAAEDDRWTPSVSPPEGALACTRRAQLVIVAVDVDLDQQRTFDAFVDATQYSAWLGTIVRIDGQNFAATLEWGTEVRGHYDVIAPPELIAMTWDFSDDNVPVPGQQLIAYLRIRPRGRGSRVEVHQHAADDVQASFLESAWSTVLGRFVAAQKAR